MPVSVKADTKGEKNEEMQRNGILDMAAEFIWKPAYSELLFLNVKIRKKFIIIATLCQVSIISHQRNLPFCGDEQK